MYPTTLAAQEAIAPIPVPGPICSQCKACGEVSAVAAMTAVVATAMTTAMAITVLSLSRSRTDEACLSAPGRRGLASTSQMVCQHGPTEV